MELGSDRFDVVDKLGEYDFSGCASAAASPFTVNKKQNKVTAVFQYFFDTNN